MALGYIAAFSETLALAVVAERGLDPLVSALTQVHHVAFGSAPAAGAGFRRGRLFQRP